MTDTFTADGNFDYVRLLSEAQTTDASLVINATGSTYDPSRKTSSTDTKGGTITSIGEISVKDDLDVVDGAWSANQVLEKSFYDKVPIERWHVNTDYKNKDGKYFAIYEVGVVTEASQSGNAGGLLTKKYTITIQGTPKRGWLTLNDAQKKNVDFAFRGVSKVNGDDAGGGTEYNFDTDRKEVNDADGLPSTSASLGTDHKN
ncbi:hypothetical protein [Lactobacillus kitasatonis]|uniref:hypothetical protein n=1 Tax=Lactobacillus kitasatonis TaxID=237446 RepID=UPI003F663BCC